MLTYSPLWPAIVVLGIVTGAAFFPFGLIGSALCFYLAYKAIIAEKKWLDAYYHGSGTEVDNILRDWLK